MHKSKQEKVKAEPYKSKTNSNQQNLQKKYALESQWSESSNLASNYEGGKNSNKPVISKNYLKTHDFIEIEGLQFNDKGQPIYHVSFRVKGKEAKEMQKCSKEDMEVIEEHLTRSVTFEYLKQLLKQTRNQQMEKEKVLTQKIDRESVQQISS